MIDKDVTPKNNIIIFRQESANQLALFVSLAQWASIRYAEDVGSIPAGYVATEMWQSHCIWFFIHIKHFFRPDHTATGCWCIKLGSIPGTGIERR